MISGGAHKFTLLLFPPYLNAHKHNLLPLKSPQINKIIYGTYPMHHTPEEASLSKILWIPTTQYDKVQN